MDNLDKQIQDFWENRTTPVERREILRQLEASGMEWKDFLQQYYNKVLAGEQSSNFTTEQKSRVWQRLQEQHLSNHNTASNSTAEPSGTSTTRTTPLPTTKLRYLPWLAAASILFIIGLFLYPSKNKPAANKTTPVATRTNTPTTIITTATTEQTLTLPDNSTVVISPGSTIHYQQSNTRSIQLEGRARFDVAKDSARPFTVTARGYTTTALGTSFIVDATKPVVSIKLLTGKIVINSMADISMQKVYLTPGQELKINTTTNHLTLNTKQPNTPENTTALSFERTNLSQVFQKLSEHYKTPILYNSADVQGLSFTGDLKPSDELDLALKVICNMNQLSFTKEKGSIVIRKQQ